MVLASLDGEIDVVESKGFCIEIRQDRCKGCEICVEFCPKNVFEADKFGRPIVQRSEDCIGCNICSLRCPDFAIEVKPKECHEVE